MDQNETDMSPSHIDEPRPKIPHDLSTVGNETDCTELDKALVISPQQFYSSAVTKAMSTECKSIPTFSSNPDLPSTSIEKTKFVSPHEIFPVPVTKKKLPTVEELSKSFEKCKTARLQTKLEKLTKKSSKGKKKIAPQRFFGNESEFEFPAADEDLDLDLPSRSKEPNDIEAECLFCSSKFSRDKHGEVWIQCLMCSMWAHVDCAGANKDEYICDFCS
ncbi:hypothetical protein ABEB36_012766 [Hypothenemus hampei]|uniref:Zinc finger PHD-type domain-containing protein n=1 Tax=Hypothenemus hampei TaxID=57062 RepID=A0ABD1ECF0_HYPHA